MNDQWRAWSARIRSRLARRGLLAQSALWGGAARASAMAKRPIGSRRLLMGAWAAHAVALVYSAGVTLCAKVGMIELADGWAPRALLEATRGWPVMGIGGAVMFALAVVMVIALSFLLLSAEALEVGGKISSERAKETGDLARALAEAEQISEATPKGGASRRRGARRL